MSSTKQYLHERFNPRSDQIPPVRIKAFQRKHLAALFGELGFKVGAEVGVAEAIYSKVLCDSIPGLHLYACDLWDTYFMDSRKLKNREMQDKCFDISQRKLAPYDVTFIRKASVEAAKDIPDGSLDFVYIDADHTFDFVMQDIIVWARKVRRGGIIAGHDYYRFRGAGVVDAVNAYTTAHQVHEWFVCDERETSFFWANEWR